MKPFHAEALEDIYSRLGTTKHGLTEELYNEYREKYGANELPKKAEENLFLLFLRQFANPLVYILVLIAVGSLRMGKYIDFLVICLVLFVNGILGWIQEIKAQKSINSLKSIVVQTTKVFRNGAVLQLNASELVPGDVILLDEGDKVPADARLISVKNFSTTEASLTGEIYPMTKHTNPLPEKTAMGDMANMVRMGTAVAR